MHYNSARYVRGHVDLSCKHAAKFEVMLEEMYPLIGQRVLDVGCAAGHFEPYVLEHGGIYLGLDVAGRFTPNTVADAEHLCFAGGSFDWVVLADVLEHLPDPRSAVQEAARVGRRVVAVVPNWYRLDRFAWLPHSPHDRHITRMNPAQWLRLFESSDFEIISLRGFFYVPSIAFYPWLPLRVLEKLFHTKPFIRLGRVVEKKYAKHPLGRFMGQELIIVAESRK